MTYTFDQLKEDVRKEAEALRVHATSEERAQLNLQRLEPSHRRHCVYGMMTGDCFSGRSATLIKACTYRYFKPAVISDIERHGFAGVQDNANGTEVIDFLEERIEAIDPCHYSAIEAYILLPEARNENLIAYLKGETETLEL
jgi:hypothetical protein